MRAIGKTLPKQAVNKPTPGGCSRSEAGFLLAGGGIIVLIIIALLSSFAFVAQRDARFKANYATGQRLAELTSLAHIYAQQQHYAVAPAVPLNLDGALLYSNAVASGLLTPPDGYDFRPNTGLRYVVEVVGANLAPVNTDVSPNVRAASAYIHFGPRVIGAQKISPSDRIAFQAGAASRGLNRLGLVNTNIAPGDICDGAATTVRWGPETSACLNAAHVTALGFSDVQNGDIIIPAWETALARAVPNAIYRYPQPERPDMNIMQTSVNMSNQRIDNGGDTLAENMTSTGVATLGDSVTDNFTIRFDSGAAAALTLDGPSTVNGAKMRIYDQTDPNAVALRVSGPTDAVFTPGTNINIADTLQDGAPLTVSVGTPGSGGSFGTDTLENRGANPILIAPNSNSQTAVLVTTTNGSSIKGININASATNPNTRLVVGQDLTTNITRNGASFGIFAAQMNAYTQINTSALNNAWTVGSIEQGPNGFIQAHRFRTNQCIGAACSMLMKNDSPPPF